jgi:two-component sensor histidine kinase
MPFKDGTSSHTNPPAPAFPSPVPRTVASHERELAAAKDMQSRLLEALARDEILLRQKDVLIRRQELLIQECNHRLLNNLQMIVSLLSLQSSKEATLAGAASLAVAANRVGAIARLHHHLHSMDGRQTVQFNRYLQELCRGHSTMSLSADQPNRDIVVEGVETSLSTVTAIPLGLIANELVTNAIKHGEGHIAVKLQSHSRKGYALSVCNAGRPLPEGFDPDACEGLGMTLVARLVEQIVGELQIDRGDLKDCTRFVVLFSGIKETTCPTERRGVTLHGTRGE